MTIPKAFDHRDTVKRREEIIALACSRLAKDLQSVNPSLYLASFDGGECSLVFQQVDQIIESRFPKGRLQFSYTGCCAIDWGRPPAVAVDLELTTDSVFVFFRLFFGAEEPTVELHHISFDKMCRDPEDNDKQLIKAFF